MIIFPSHFFFENQKKGPSQLHRARSPFDSNSKRNEGAKRGRKKFPCSRTNFHGAVRKESLVQRPGFCAKSTSLWKAFPSFPRML